MSLDQDYPQLLENFFEQVYEHTKNTVQPILDDMVPTDQINKDSLKISNKSEFIKGYAVAMFYGMSNQVDTASEKLNIQKPYNALQIKEKLQNNYAQKLCNYFDIPH